MKIRTFYLIVLLPLGLPSCKNSSSHVGHTSTAGPGYADSVNAGMITKDTLKGSPERVAMQTIGNVHYHITYHSPGVKGRMIWGGLVPYNQVWVTGAHNATRLQVDTDARVGEQKLAAGTYAIFTIPGEQEWTFILNKNYQQHLADNYSAAEDVLRLQVKPSPVNMTERLTYRIEKTEEHKGMLIMAWDTLKIQIPLSDIM